MPSRRQTAWEARLSGCVTAMTLVSPRSNASDRTAAAASVA